MAEKSSLEACRRVFNYPAFMITTLRRFLPLLLILILVVGVGTIGYVLIEGWSFTEALFMTVITLTTVGFGEIRPLSQTGRWFTIALILLGVGTVVYSLSLAGEYLFTSDIGKRLRERRMRNRIKKMKDHVIVCGYGRVGNSAIDALEDSSQEMALIENDPDKVQAAIDRGLTVVQGDATDDAILQAAGIEHAQTLIVCLDNNTTNLFIVLSARVLNPALRIIVRGETGSKSKMLRAGADRVVSPYQISGKYMANVALRPHVTNFLDVVTLQGGIELWLEELKIEAGSALVGQTVGQVDVRQRTGVTLVAILRKDETELLTPNANTHLMAGDRLIVLGSRSQLEAMGSLTN